MNLFCFLNMNKNMSKSKFTSRQKLVKMQLVTHTAQNGFGVTEEPFELLLDGSSVISSGSSSSSPYSTSLIKVSGMLSGFGVVRTTFWGSFKAEDIELNFGGGGGGMVLGGGGGILSVDDWTNFFGGSIVERFLTPIGSPGCANSFPCEEFWENNQ